MKKCIGFGKYEGKCVNYPNYQNSRLWCPTCEELRQNHVDGCFKNILEGFSDQGKSQKKARHNGKN